jgi:AcrR family transcriptional regulator
MEGPTEGLRDRKKRATRDTIGSAARRLFAERGFDAVTVAEVAAAADVSEKTVFNHFATKEDLAFAGGERRLQDLIDAITRRPPGTSVVDVFRAKTNEMLDKLGTTDPDDDVMVMPRIIRGSPVLQERLATGWERESAALTQAIAASTPDVDEIVAGVVARTLSLTNRTIFREAVKGMFAGEDPDALAARLREQAARVYDQH